MLTTLLLQSSGAPPQVDTWQAVAVAVVSMIFGGGGVKLCQLWLQARRAEHQHEQKMAHLDEGAAAKANALLLTEVQRLAARVAVLEAAAEKHVAAAERWKQAHEECERSKTALLIRVETLEAEVGSLERQVAALKQQQPVAPKPARRPRKEGSNATTG